MKILASVPRSASRSRDLIEAARHCVFEIGINHVTAEGIASRAGVSPGLIYHYFESKDDLVLAAVKAQEERLQEELENALSRCHSAAEKLRGWMEFMLPETTQREMWRYWFELWAYASRDERMRSVCRGAYVRWRDIRDSILVEGIQNGEFRDVDVQATGEMLGALVEGLSRRYLLKGYLGVAEVRKVLQGVVDYLAAVR